MKQLERIGSMVKRLKIGVAIASVLSLVIDFIPYVFSPHQPGILSALEVIFACIAMTAAIYSGQSAWIYNRHKRITVKDHIGMFVTSVVAAFIVTVIILFLISALFYQGQAPFIYNYQW